jgi:uncharacterized protein YbjT (DUF2867 family)
LGLAAAPETQPKIALLAGATGLVGGLLLDVLLEAPDFTRIVAVTRRPLTREHPRLANRTAQLERLGPQFAGFTCHTVFCCLGTTIKTAGSEQAFRAVDLGLALALASFARGADAQRFVVVSSVGADANSKNFYLRTKGEMEQALEQTQFPSLDILQPSVLLGSRRELRPVELLARVLAPVINPLLLGKRSVYRAIPARSVALAMLGAARSGRRGVNRYTYDAIVALSHKGARGAAV